MKMELVSKIEGGLMQISRKDPSVHSAVQNRRVLTCGVRRLLRLAWVQMLRREHRVKSKHRSMCKSTDDRKSC